MCMCKHTGANQPREGAASMSSQETAQTAVQGREYQGVSIPPVGTYELDPTHTVVGFVARHMLSKVRGQFTEFTAPIEVAGSPENSRVDVAGMTWSVAVEAGGFLVGKKVDLEIEVEAHRVS